MKESFRPSFGDIQEWLMDAFRLSGYQYPRSPRTIQNELLIRSVAGMATPPTFHSVFDDEFVPMIVSVDRPVGIGDKSKKAIHVLIQDIERAIHINDEIILKLRHRLGKFAPVQKNVPTLPSPMPASKKVKYQCLLEYEKWSLTEIDRLRTRIRKLLKVKQARAEAAAAAVNTSC